MECPDCGEDMERSADNTEWECVFCGLVMPDDLS